MKMGNIMRNNDKNGIGREERGKGQTGRKKIVEPEFVKL